MLRDLRRLLELSLRRKESAERYREFQSFQARLLLGYLEGHGIRLAGAWVLDLGSGFGGYSREFAARGARVISLDPTPSRVVSARLHSVAADATAIPVCDSSMDFVFCASLIEHVRRPAEVLAEIERTLRPGGTSYVSFPPYYSPMGGHECAPFHYFGERAALWWHRRHRTPAWLRTVYRQEARTLAELYGEFGLNKMTVGLFRRLLGATRLECVDLSTRYFPVSFVGWPWVGEVLTWHAQFLVRKVELPPSAPPDRGA